MKGIEAAMCGSARDPISFKPLSELIGSIYDCALEPDRWDQTLADIRDALDAQAAVLHLNDLRRDRVLIQKIVGIEPFWQEQHARYVPAMHRLLPPRPTLDEPHVLSRHVSPAVIAASPFVQSWLRPQGLIDIMQLFLMHTPSHFLGLGIVWHERHGVATERDIELACLLLAHLRRAVAVSNVLDARAIACAGIAEALDALRCGVVLVNDDGIILHANRVAVQMLMNGHPIRSAQGMLGAQAQAAAKELQTAIRLSARNETRIGKAGIAIRLTEPDAPPVFAHVLPMSGGDRRMRLQPKAVAAVFVPATWDEQDEAATMAATFGLTPAETRVLAGLLAGRTLAEAAAALSVAVTTAKTHLENIFQKTGVNRQVELIALASRVAPPARSTT